MRQHAKPHSSISENLPSSISDIPISLRPSSGIETSFTDQSNQRSSHLNGDQESVFSLSAFISIDFAYHTLESNSRPPTPDVYHYPLRLDNQIFNHPIQDLRFRILPVIRTNNTLQYSVITLYRELTRLNPSSTELKFEVTVKLIRLNTLAESTSTQKNIERILVLLL